MRRFTAGVTAGGVALLVAAPVDHAARADVRTGESALSAPTIVPTAGHPRGHRWPGHPGRWVKHYTVRRGDTATGLAVRYHAWTAELLELNHLSRRSTLHVGDRLRIPIVIAAYRRAQRTRHHHTAHHHTARHPARRAPHPRPHPRPHHVSRWTWAHADRGTVRGIVVGTARRHHVDPRLALAIAWQESGWQQYRVSSAGALGVMQVMPSTGRWLSLLVGRSLHLRHLHDNVTAGVVLLAMLREQAGPKRTIAGYYQGLSSVRKDGMYPSTRRYVASVLAIQARLRHGWDPA
jgi:LysM repeat protein